MDNRQLNCILLLFELTAVVLCPRKAAEFHSKSGQTELFWAFSWRRVNRKCPDGVAREVINMIRSLSRFHVHSASELQTHQNIWKKNERFVIKHEIAPSDVRYLLLSRVMCRHVEIESIFIDIRPKQLRLSLVSRLITKNFKFKIFIPSRFAI